MSSPNENVLLKETNKGGYTLSIIARFEEPFPLQYIIRLSTPDGNEVDFMSTLEGFKNIGDACMQDNRKKESKNHQKIGTSSRENS